jgi:hypothetical protein
LSGQINRDIDIPRQTLQTLSPLSRWINLPKKGKYQHLAPTVCTTNKQPAMALKRASSKVAPSIDEAAKAACWLRKKGKALADNTPQEASEDEVVSKRQCQEHPTPEGTLRTCSSGGLPQVPLPGFAPPEGEDAIEDGEVIGISAEEQL